MDNVYSQNKTYYKKGPPEKLKRKFKSENSKCKNLEQQNIEKVMKIVYILVYKDIKLFLNACIVAYLIGKFIKDTFTNL